MNFIEQFFHISPDGGSGVLETTILILLLVAPVVFVVLRIRRSSKHRFL
jgi:hypothetical protein